MNVELMSFTSLSVADRAICKCYNNKPHSDLEKQQKRINNVANVHKHASTIEHLVYSFDIDGISRACLQEIARHRIASYTVKSTRYTLKELKTEAPFISLGCAFGRAEKYLVMTDDFATNTASVTALEALRQILIAGIPNDKAKYCLPEAYKTSLVMTINARSLQNFLALRTDSHALWEIQELAREMYQVIPENHKFLFKDYVNETN